MTEESKYTYILLSPIHFSLYRYLKGYTSSRQLSSHLVRLYTMGDEIQDYYRTVLSVVKKAGELVKSEFYKVKKIEIKENYADMVTETDVAVEKMLMSSLAEKYPNHKFIGEETVAEGGNCDLTDDPTWIIDPIDGTSNFVHSIQNTCISIALAVKKEIVIGIVHCAITDELYSAVRGQGAFCNEERLSVSKETDLKRSVVILEGGNSRDQDILNIKLSNMKEIINRSHGIRSYGSAALNGCFVAKGNHQAYLEHGIHVWDIAAAKLIVEEAGGVAVDPSGGPVDLFNRRILVACNREVADQIAKVINNDIKLARD